MEHIILYVTERATGEAQLPSLQVGAHVEVQVKYKTQVRACLRSPWPITHSVLSTAPDTPAPREPASFFKAVSKLTPAARLTVFLGQLLGSVAFRLVVHGPRRGHLEMPLSGRPIVFVRMLVSTK